MPLATGSTARRRARAAWSVRGHVPRATPARALIALSLCTLLLAACGGEDGTDNGTDTTDDGQASEPEATGEVQNWDYFMALGPQHPFTLRAMELADAVEEATDGQLVITVRPAGELPYAPPEALRRAGDGSVQIAEVPSSAISGDCPVAATVTLPGLVANGEEWEVAEDILTPYSNECFASFGAEVLYGNYFPTQQWWGQGEPVTDSESLAGMQIRAQGAEFGLLVESIGAEPVTMTADEVAPALQRGVVDAVITAAITAEGSQWGEFLDWGLQMDLGVGTSYILVNSQAYEELPADVREALDTVVEEFAQRVLDENPALEEESLAELEELGVEVNVADEEDRERVLEQVEPAWEEWAQEGGPEMEEALAAIRDELGK